MVRGGCVVDGEVNNTERRNGDIKGNGQVIHPTPNHTRCKWGASREVKTAPEAVEEKTEFYEMRKWGDYEKDGNGGYMIAPRTILRARLVRKRRLEGSGSSGRGQRIPRLWQEEQHPSRSTSGDWASTRYISQVALGDTERRRKC